MFFFAAKLLIALGEACVAITTAAFCCKTACDPCCFSGFVGTGTGSGGLEDAAVIFKPDTPVANGGRGGRDVGGQATVPIESILDASITNDRGRCFYLIIFNNSKRNYFLRHFNIVVWKRRGCGPRWVWWQISPILRHSRLSRIK